MSTKSASTKSLKSSSSSNLTEIIKVGVIGPKNVGKTSLTSQFISSTFLEKYIPTLEEDIYMKPFAIGTQHYKMELIDTKGGLAQDNFIDQIKEWGKRCKGVLLVYNMTSTESNHLKNVEDILSLLKSSNPELHIVLVGIINFFLKLLIYYFNSLINI
jgi:small GTP-binding protein